MLVVRPPLCVQTGKMRDRLDAHAGRYELREPTVR